MLEGLAGWLTASYTAATIGLAVTVSVTGSFPLVHALLNPSQSDLGPQSC